MTLPEKLYDIKFAESFEFIKQRYLMDERFRELCDSYCQAAEECVFFSKASQKNHRLSQKRKNLADGLREEILFYAARNQK